MKSNDSLILFRPFSLMFKYCSILAHTRLDHVLYASRCRDGPLIENNVGETLNPRGTPTFESAYRLTHLSMREVHKVVVCIQAGQKIFEISTAAVGNTLKHFG